MESGGNVVSLNPNSQFISTHAIFRQHRSKNRFERTRVPSGGVPQGAPSSQRGVARAAERCVPALFGALDSNGRFLIPKRYLKMADIEQGIKFIGMGDTIEIWSTAKTEKPFMDPDDFGKALEEVMGNASGLANDN